jgi:tRNA G18 (ribose-2'-O)-methylase SpoU|tara:strand:+ start:582 stop:1115 length:534 start_codon:yes stop_codon:yes gene_type:complete
VRKIKNSELNRLSVEGFKAAKKSPLIVILDNVRSLNNVGSIFRSADAFRIQHIYLCGITATPPHKDIQKTALGSTEAVDWSYAKDTLAVVEKLQSVNVKVMAIEQAENATVLQDFYPNNQSIYALVFGHEVKGVNQAVVNQCDGVIEIPQYGTKHSLNIAVSGGVVLWDLFSKMNQS